MDFLRDTALCLIMAAAAGTFITVIVPRGSMDKTARAVTGIFVVAVICSPLSEIEKSDPISDVFADFGEYDFDDSYAENMNGALVNTFRTALENQLEEIATELDFEIRSVDADVSVDDEQCINIHSVSVYTSESELYDAEELSKKISDKLGLPVDVTEE